MRNSKTLEFMNNILNESINKKLNEDIPVIEDTVDILYFLCKNGQNQFKNVKELIDAMKNSIHMYEINGGTGEETLSEYIENETLRPSDDIDESEQLNVNNLKVGDKVTFRANGRGPKGGWVKNKLMQSEIKGIHKNDDGTTMAYSCSDPDHIKSFDFIYPEEILSVNGMQINESEENKNVSYKVYVDTVFGKIDVVVNAKSEEEAKEIALDRVRDAFVNKYRDDINIDRVLLAESEQLNEKRNPENDEANELIRNSLNDPEFAKTHAQELRKHGIKYLKPSEDWGDNGALEGKEGRRLAINTDPNWRKDDIDYSTGRFMNDKATYQKDYSRDNIYADQNDLHQKTYIDSKMAFKHAKDNIDKQAKKVARLEKKNKEAGIGFDDKLYKEKGKLNNYKNRIEAGITPKYKDTTKIHPDTDLKGFLNAKKHSDRPLARENDPKYKRAYGRVADPINKDVEDYKANQYEKKDIDREKEYNARQDREDKERIETMKQRAKEDKVRRDSYINKRQKEANKVDNRINKKLDNFRKRMNK